MRKRKAKEPKIRIPYDDTETMRNRILERAEKEDDSMNKTIHKGMAHYLDYLDRKEGGKML